uniref:Uncharacterized protein n=2 Tax=Emiliania huxleyi TaxID=2903 RepID=A0A0D3K927_EMIH1
MRSRSRHAARARAARTPLPPTRRAPPPASPLRSYTRRCSESAPAVESRAIAHESESKGSRRRTRVDTGSPEREALFATCG